MASLVPATPGVIVSEVARLLGTRIIANSTATAGGSGTLTGANLPIQADASNDDFYNNLFMWLAEGTGVGEQGHVRDYDGANQQFTLDGLSSTPDTTTVFTLMRQEPAMLFDAVEAAIRELALTVHTRLAHAGLRVGNIVHDGHFEHWDGSSSVSSGSFIHTRWTSDGWKVNGTSATAQREATIARNSSPYTRYAGKLTSDTTNDAYLEWLVANWGQYAGLTGKLIGWVYATASDRARLRVDDGVTQHTTDTGGSSGDHSGTAGWEELSIDEITLSSALTKLGVQCFIEGTGGGAITSYFDDIRFIPTQFSLDYRLPPGFTHVKQVYVETGTEGHFGRPLPHKTPRGRDFWQVVTHDDGRPYLRFDPHSLQDASLESLDTLGGLLTKDRHLLVEGAGYRTDTIAADTEIEFDPQLVAYMAAAEIAASWASGETAQGQFWDRRARHFEREADRMKLALPKRRPSGSVRVR